MKAARPAPEPPARAGEEEGGTFRETTIGEFLDIPPHEMKAIDLKVGLVRAIREHRKAAKLSQAALAKVMGVSQPRIAEIERHEPTVTLDTLFAAYFAAGGTGAELGAIGAHLDAIAGT